ncbi:MAG: MBL fold metallo-hydrolase [Bacillota bacterium]
MRIVTLLENTASDEKFEAAHGISLYIEAKKHTILFDMGPDDKFIKNAEALGIDLRDVDIAILSHAHYDHGGGLEAFMELNDKATIYVHEDAFSNVFSEKESGEKVYIGLKQSLKESDRIVYTSGFKHIDNGVEVFSGVEAKRFIPKANSHLYKQKAKVLVKDDFTHEQNLSLKENDQSILISGCAHKGIVNIMDHFHKLKDYYPDAVIGGFHLSKGLEDATFEELGETMQTIGARYITGHCTKEEAFNALKPILGDKLEALSSGKAFEL